MKITFNNFSRKSNIYATSSVNIKYSKIKNSQNATSFNGDTFERKTDKFNSLEEKYGNIKKNLALLKQEKNVPRKVREGLTMELLKTISEISGFNEILSQSDPKNYDKDYEILLNYYLTTKNLSKERGFNRIAGYNDVKENLNTDFIMKVMGRARTSQETDAPNAFLLYGPTGCGKTAFATALAEQSLSNVQNINSAELLPEEFLKTLKNAALEAEKNYTESKDEKKKNNSCC